MAGEIDGALRQEIVECQKAKAEFVRWKLIIVAAVGAAALGLGENPGMPLLATLIPLVSVYVDSACLHNDSRILMIAEFLRTSSDAGDESRAYEQHCHEKRHRFYGEGFVLFVTTAVLSTLTIGLGMYAWGGGDSLSSVACVVGGSAGLLGTYFLVRNFRKIQEGRDPLQIVSLGSR